MSIKSSIISGDGRRTEAKVTSRGQLVVAPLEYSEAYNATAGTANTAANLIAPKTSKQFVITSISLYANKNVGVSDATVVLYEATSDSTATVTKTLMNLEMAQKTRVDLQGLNVLVTQGFWVNIKTDDDDVFATLFGYYIDAEPSQ